MSVGSWLLARRRGSGERGQALVEMAIISLVLLTVVVLAIDVGRVYFAYTGIRGAAERGVLVASDYLKDGTAINTAVKNEPGGFLTLEDSKIFVDCPGLPPANPSIPESCRVRGLPVRVTVQTTFVPVTPFAQSVLGTTLTIQAAAEAVVM